MTSLRMVRQRLETICDETLNELLQEDAESHGNVGYEAIVRAQDAVADAIHELVNVEIAWRKK